MINYDFDHEELNRSVSFELFNMLAQKITIYWRRSNSGNIHIRTRLNFILHAHADLHHTKHVEQGKNIIFKGRGTEFELLDCNKLMEIMKK